uniref:Uncharacterized protein n=1 Tax=Anguilla anguilla TaxID=7936 RepID=A0A0E9WMF8_ANGAN
MYSYQLVEKIFSISLWQKSAKYKYFSSTFTNVYICSVCIVYVMYSSSVIIESEVSTLVPY